LSTTLGNVVDDAAVEDEREATAKHLKLGVRDDEADRQLRIAISGQVMATCIRAWLPF
jgi:hypothetical protein